MSIFVDETTKVVYQGLTGSQGRFYGLLNKEYGTQVVAGTNPKKAGTDVEGIPVFASVADAVAETGATASCIFIPAPGVRDAVIEAACAEAAQGEVVEPVNFNAPSQVVIAGHKAAVERGVEIVLAVGPLARAYGDARWVETADEAVTALDDVLQPGDAVLVKASRALGLELVAEAIEGVRV